MIGIKSSVLYQDSIVFSGEFYRILAHGRNFEEAFDRARSVLGLTSTMEVHLLKSGR